MNRTITVWESSKQKKTVIENSSATTLGELKAEMEAAGVDLNNMDILEGVSHTKLLSNESPLPHDIPYKGNITNDLMIYLTLQNKKVASGAISRQEIGQWIKENNLGDEVKSTFGDNWTRVSTSNLVAFYEAKTKVSAPATEPKEEQKAEASKTTVDVEAKVDAALEALNILTEALYDDNTLYSSDYSKVKAVINSVKSQEGPKQDEAQGGFSMDEINSMIDGM